MPLSLDAIQRLVLALQSNEAGNEVANAINTALALAQSRGIGVIPGGTTGQVLSKISNLDFAVQWAAAGSSGTPGGSNTQIQFNDGGSFGANAGFTFDKTTGILQLGDIKTRQNWLTAYWSGPDYSSPAQPGVLVDSALRNALDINIQAVLFGSTDVSGLGDNQPYISTDVSIQSGSNLGDNLDLSGSYATGNVWIHPGDILNDTSGSSYSPGILYLVSGRHMVEGFGSGMIIDATGIASNPPNRNELWTRSSSFKFFSRDNTLVMTVVNDGKYVEMDGNPIKNIGYTPTNPGNWGAIVPTTIEQALNLIAAKIAPVS